MTSSRKSLSNSKRNVVRRQLRAQKNMLEKKILDFLEQQSFENIWVVKDRKGINDTIGFELKEKEKTFFMFIYFQSEKDQLKVFHHAYQYEYRHNKKIKKLDDFIKTQLIIQNNENSTKRFLKIKDLELAEKIEVTNAFNDWVAGYIDNANFSIQDNNQIQDAKKLLGLETENFDELNAASERKMKLLSIAAAMLNYYLGEEIKRFKK